jgi:hypothetical protein
MKRTEFAGIIFLGVSLLYTHETNSVEDIALL